MMRVLEANLELYYRRGGLWLNYLLIGATVGGMAGWAKYKGLTGGAGYVPEFLVLCLAVGILVFEMQRDILSKPFSFCLPRGEQVVRRVILWAGLVVAALGALIFPAYQDGGLSQQVLKYFAMLLAGLVWYCAGSFAAVFFYSTSMIGLFPVAVIVFIFLMPHALPGGMIVNHQPYVIVAGFAASIMFWRFLNRTDLRRRYAGKLLFSSADGWTRQYEMAKLRQIEKAKKAGKGRWSSRQWAERFYWKQMNKCGYSTTSRYVWGALYKSVGEICCFYGGFWSLLMYIPMIMFFGYWHDLDWAFLLLITGICWDESVNSPVRSTMLISGGRKERYSEVAVLAVQNAIFPLMAALIMVTFSQIWVRVSPRIFLWDKTLEFNPINVSMFWLPLFIVPISSVIIMLFRGFARWMLQSLACGLCAAPFLVLHELNKDYLLANPVFAIGMLSCSWGVSLLIMRLICKRRSLGGGGAK